MASPSPDANRFVSLRESREEEQGDIVQTILIIALFIVIIVAVFNTLTPAVTGQGKEIAYCVANAHRGFSSCNF